MSQNPTGNFFILEMGKKPFITLNCSTKECDYTVKGITSRFLVDYINRPCPCCSNFLLNKEEHAQLQKELFFKKISPNVGNFSYGIEK